MLTAAYSVGRIAMALFGVLLSCLKPRLADGLSIVLVV